MPCRLRTCFFEELFFKPHEIEYIRRVHQQVEQLLGEHFAERAQLRAPLQRILIPGTRDAGEIFRREIANTRLVRRVRHGSEIAARRLA